MTCNPGIDRFSPRGDLPGRAARSPGGLDERAVFAVPVAVDEDNTAGDIVAVMNDRRETAVGLDAAQQRAGPNPGGEARLAQAAALCDEPARTA